MSFSCSHKGQRTLRDGICSYASQDSRLLAERLLPPLPQVVVLIVSESHSFCACFLMFPRPRASFFQVPNAAGFCTAVVPRPVDAGSSGLR
eukprot:5218987-Amphidinium_carterae.1